MVRLSSIGLTPVFDYAVSRTSLHSTERTTFHQHSSYSAGSYHPHWDVEQQACREEYNLMLFLTAFCAQVTLTRCDKQTVGSADRGTPH